MDRRRQSIFVRSNVIYGAAQWSAVTLRMAFVTRSGGLSNSLKEKVAISSIPIAFQMFSSIDIIG
jgi:hypothetical protein